MKIGFIGVGVMGESIVKHLLGAKHDVYVYSRTKEKTNAVVQLGAIWCNSPLEITNNTDVIFTMVGYPSDVTDVYFGENGIFKGNITGKICIDLTTSTPTLAKEIETYATHIGAYALDAPVSGGDIGAKNGTLTTMVGGNQDVFNRVESLLNVFSSKVKRQGEAGAGQHTKMANQIMIAATMLGMCELMVYAKATGLNVGDVMETVGAGSAQNWSLSNYGPRVLNGDFAPGFYAKHLLKDLKIALDEAQKLNLSLPGLETAKMVYEKLCDLGYGNDGTQSLINIYTY